MLGVQNFLRACYRSMFDIRPLNQSEEALYRRSTAQPGVANQNILTVAACVTLKGRYLMCFCGFPLDHTVIGNLQNMNVTHMHGLGQVFTRRCLNYGACLVRFGPESRLANTALWPVSTVSTQCWKGYTVFDDILYLMYSISALMSSPHVFPNSYYYLDNDA